MLYVVVGNCYNIFRTIHKWNVEVYRDAQQAMAHIEALNDLVKYAQMTAGEFSYYSQLTGPQQIALSDMLRSAPKPDTKLQTLTGYPWYSVDIVPDDN